MSVGSKIPRGAPEWHLGERRKMGPRPRLHEGRLCSRTRGGVFTPILTFPPQEGRDGKEGAHEGRSYGGRVVRWAVGMAHTNELKRR